MGDRRDLEFRPDYAVPPGRTLLETIEEHGMSQAELASRTGRPLKTINEIIKGKAAITPTTALQLERALGVPARLWNNLETNYREALARIEEQRHLDAGIAWLNGIPVRALVREGVVRDLPNKADMLAELLNFFGVGSPSSWERVWSRQKAAFRRSLAFEISPGSVAAWLRIGELTAQKITCSPFARNRFRAALTALRRLTVEPPEVFQPQLERLCAEAGVAVVFVSELPKTRVSGATRWLTSNKALIQLSLRYKTDDHLWFTFFHEAGHILLHGKRDIFLEGNGADDIKEQEANRFAANILIPPTEFQTFLKKGEMTGTAIQRFATQLRIAPGIVVGRLQHEDILPYSHCNDLRRRFVLVTSTERVPG